MRILQVNEHLALKGGVETYLLGLIPQIEARGHDVCTAYGSGDAALTNHAFRVPQIGRIGRRAEREGYAEMSRRLDAARPDIVHLHNVQNIGIVAACLDAAPTVMTGHDYRMLCPASMFYFKRTQSICQRTCGPGCFAKTLTHHCLSPRPKHAYHSYRRVQWMARQADRIQRVIAPSKGAAARFRLKVFTNDQVVVLPYFCPLPALREPRRRPLTPTVTFMGRITANKGCEYFIEALGILPERVHGLVIGSLTANTRSRLVTLAERAGCADRLNLRPWADRDQVSDIYRQTTVFIFPSIWDETLGIVGLEALAHGVPVVASDVGGVRQWLKHVKNGLLVPPKDSRAIAAAAMKILESDHTQQAMGRNGIETIKKQFTSEHHVGKLLSIYEACSQQPVGRLAGQVVTT